MSKHGMIVAGVMSGTSADGIDVALVRIAGGSHAALSTASGSRGRGRPRHIPSLIGHASFSYPPKVRAAVLSAMNATQASVAELSRLNSLLGHLYAEAVVATQSRFRVKADLIGCHGQTIYHQGELQAFLGRKITTTWQIGEGAIIAARVGVPVVSDFRPADMAAGGKGAPLVPYLDYLWFRDPKIGRIVQNIGGIANLTAIAAGGTADAVLAFDTGPGNMVIDAVTHELFGKSFDRGGNIAASGRVIEPVVRRILPGPFFRAKPPKTAGREEFGREFVREFLRACGRARKQDIVATATALTAWSIGDAIERFVIRKILTSPKIAAKRGTHQQHAFHEIILSGGGAKNRTLVQMIAERLTPLGIRVRFSDEFGLRSEAKEAVAFAMLAYETWHRRASNVPSATGAKRAAVLGKISYA
ncbi:MAG TPA: anhydro-N-acetylmuramic acid kinase [Candidatus Sulfotelmatobacter sp.]|nr:anhydro-N-acetylmuramic acid kinase [Candidatus Sulfotelmatobacter sp.]